MTWFNLQTCDLQSIIPGILVACPYYSFPPNNSTTCHINSRKSSSSPLLGVSGFVAANLYKKMGGNNWVWNINLTSALFARKYDWNLAWLQTSFQIFWLRRNLDLRRGGLVTDVRFCAAILWRIWQTFSFVIAEWLKVDKVVGVDEWCHLWNVSAPFEKDYC